MRQWAGSYDVTPDNNPILGAAGPANFLQLNGFVGHGFMMAPAVTEAMADWMTGREKDEIFDRFTLDRFAERRRRGRGLHHRLEWRPCHSERPSPSSAPATWPRPS